MYVNGRRMSIPALAKETGLCQATLYLRYQKGWRGEKLIKPPPVKANRRDTPTANSYYTMIQRCHNPSNPNYKCYGAKGVTVCARWRKSFDSFVEDMGERPDGMTLDRIDPFGSYHPSNCRWATPEAQAQNKRDTIKVFIRGELLTIKEISAKYGLSPRTLRYRISCGKTEDELIASDNPKLHTILGFTGTQAEISRQFGVKDNSLCQWLKISTAHAEAKVRQYGRNVT